MNKLNPWIVGGAIAIAFGITYIGCALSYALWPDAALGFFNAWFHGIDITILETSKTFTVGMFLYGLVSVMASAFIFGVILSFTYNALTLVARGSAAVSRRKPQPH